MNIQIQELADRAKQTARVTVPNYRDDPVKFNQVFAELFAQSIALQCISICFDKAEIQAEYDNVKSGHKEEAYMDAGHSIRQHFGI